ncbi:MAG: S-methyl-5'-thioadenosine phosphorylase [Candidatus Omnitrophota bacterium]
MKNRIGIIGGSGLSDIEGLEAASVSRRRVDTPFGRPSDEFVIGKMHGKEVVFLPRHGRGHSLLPTEVNCRANIYAFKLLGVNRIISVSAVGSLREDLCPLDVVIVDQFVDRTNQARPDTFFGAGIVAHISFAKPVCPELREVAYNANIDVGVKIHNGGTYINMEGPAFSTKAESYLYKSWGMDVIGMTNINEARLAREAGICYMTLAMVTDYDSWHDALEYGTVTVEMILDNLRKNAETSKKMLENIIREMPGKRSCGCSEALRDAIITDRKLIPKETLEKLKPIVEGFI